MPDQNTIPAGSASEYHEAIVVGAGMCGLCQLHWLLEAGIEAIGVDGNADVGGTWFNNRYPGCRFDSESYTYGFSFSDELLNGWHWKEHFSPQSENYKYTQFVTEKFGLREYIRFNLRVEAAHFDEEYNLWNLHLSHGRVFSCRFLFLSLGGLSKKTLPRFDGIEDFAGPWFHTIDWPHEPLDLQGKRVAVFGTGASGVQVIQTIAEEVDELSVLQRRPNWCAPLNNSKISEHEMAEIRSRLPEIFETCLWTPGGFVHVPDRRGFYNVSRKDRLALWERLYDEPGFGIWLQNFVEIFTDEEANAEFSEFIADRIRERVDDPEIAEKLIPRDHGFGVQRVPLETRYYETYNRDNVRLVSLEDEPVERITPVGIQTSRAHYEVDIIVYATGFDAGVGSYLDIDIRGVGGQRLTDKWRNGPLTLMGAMINGFPNLLTPNGPQAGGASINVPRAIEMCVEFTTGLVRFMHDNDKSRFEASKEAEAAWLEEVRRAARKLLTRKAQNWIVGINRNIEGRESAFKNPLGYGGGNPKYRKFLRELAEGGYQGIELV